MDPQLTEGNKPAQPVIYRNIVKERYFISKHCHTPYKDTGDISPTERRLLLDFIKEDYEREQKQREELEGKKKLV